MTDKFGLANVPFWAFPLTDDGWKELDEMPLFRRFTHFSNNNPDSRWWPFHMNEEDVDYILERLAERKKVYRFTLIDRNSSYGPGDEEDDDIRRRLLGGIKRGDTWILPLALDAACSILTVIGSSPAATFMVYNGAEGKDSLDAHKFDWDFGRPSRSLKYPENLLEALLARIDPRVVTGDFRHRYWAKNPDGTLYRHYHSTLAPTGLSKRRIYQETGVHANLGDDRYWLERQYLTLSRHADEWWWHGVIHVNAAEQNPVYAWSAETISKLEYPVERKEYFGYLAGEQGREVEKWLTERELTL